MATRSFSPIILLILLTSLTSNVSSQIPIHGPLSGTMVDTEYLVVGNIWVGNNDSLFIGPSTTFLFNGPFEFVIRGLLRAEGAEQDSVFFRRNTVDVLWEGINFVDTSSDSCLLRYCLIEGSEDTGIEIIGCRPTIDHSTIQGNSGMGTSLTGGISISDSGKSTISNCVITENAGIRGGGINIQNSQAIISHCTIARNCAIMGAGICLYYNGSSEAVIDHCLIMDNSVGEGGGIFILGSGARVTIKNCTITGNSGSHELGFAGGIQVITCRYAQVVNTIITNNDEGGVSGVHKIRYSCLYNNPGGNFPNGGPDSVAVLVMVNANGDSCDRYRNIFKNPLYVNPGTGNYHLRPPSACIDAGDPRSPFDPDSTIADIGAFYYDQSTGISPLGHIELPTTFRLMHNYPNPFNAFTQITYQLPRFSHVSLMIYNILGQHIETLFDGFQQFGTHSATWDATDYPSGLYFARLQTSEYTKTVKMVLLK